MNKYMFEKPGRMRWPPRAFSPVAPPCETGRVGPRRGKKQANW